MPEFILEGRDHAARAESDFTLGFMEAAFFTSREPTRTMADWLADDAAERREEGQESEVPADAGYLEIHPDSLAAVRTFCQSWQDQHALLLRRAYMREGYSEAQAGTDLWFTMTGSGVGYWDRDTLEAEGLGQDLSDAAGSRECSLWFGDDSRVHFDGLPMPRRAAAA